MKRYSLFFIIHPVMGFVFYVLTYGMCFYGIVKHSVNLGLSISNGILVFILSFIASFLLGYDEYCVLKKTPIKKDKEHQYPDKKAF